jgi:hypothetical protein
MWESGASSTSKYVFNKDDLLYLGQNFKCRPQRCTLGPDERSAGPSVLSPDYVNFDDCWNSTHPFPECSGTECNKVGFQKQVNRESCQVRCKQGYKMRQDFIARWAPVTS